MGKKILHLLLLSMLLWFAITANSYDNEIPKVVVNHDVNNASKSITSSANSKKISANEIENSSAQSLNEILQGNFGVQINDLYGDGNNTNISMRGFGDNAAANSLILLNGIPLENPDLSPITLNFIAPKEIDQIEILPSSSGVKYGDQSVGGVININTEQPKSKYKSATASYGSFNSKLINAKVSDKFNNSFGYLINASHYYSDNYRQHNKLQNNSFNTLLNYADQTNCASVYYWHVDKHMHFPGALTKEQENSDPKQATDNIAFDNQNINLIQAKFKTKIYNDYMLQINTFAQQLHGMGAFSMTNADNTKAPSNFTEKRRSAAILPSISSISNVFNHTIIPELGIEIKKGEYNYFSEFHNSSSSQLQQALYSQLNSFITPKLSLLIGGRAATSSYDLQYPNNVNSNNPTNKAIATTVESKYAISQNISFFIKRADSYRFPKTDEQTWTIDSEPLKTQKGVSYESGINIKKKQFSFLLDIYKLDIKDEIMVVPDPSSDYFFSYNENIDPTRRIGIIVNNSLQISSFWKLDLDLSLVNAKFSSGDYSGNRIPFVPEKSLRISNSITVADSWNLYLESIYAGNRYAANDVENRTELIGGYTTFNLGLNRIKPNYEIGIRINNLFDKRYDSYTVSTYQSDAVSTVYYPAASINGMLSLTIKI